MSRVALRLVVFFWAACVALVLVVRPLAQFLPGDVIAYTLRQGFGTSGCGAASSCNADLYLVDLRSNSQVNLTHTSNAEEQNPIWSPDGGKIAYYHQSADENGISICVFDTRTHCYQTAVQSFSGLLWSPDSSKIAYRDIHSVLHLLDLTSGEDHSVNPDLKPTYWGWSPDGSRLVLTSDAPYTRDADACCAIYLGDGNLDSLYPIYQGNLRVRSVPNWSLDGRYLTFAAQDEEYTNHIYRLDTETGDLHMLADFDGYDLSWSPDGTQIAFISGSEDSLELYLMDADGGNLHRVTEIGRWRELEYVWSSDGTRILLMADQRGGDQIYVFDLQSGRLEQLPAGSGQKTELAWRP